eukprot:284819282_5
MWLSRLVIRTHSRCKNFSYTPKLQNFSGPTLPVHHSSSSRNVLVVQRPQDSECRTIAGSFQYPVEAFALDVYLNYIFLEGLSPRRIGEPSQILGKFIFACRIHFGRSSMWQKSGSSLEVFCRPSDDALHENASNRNKAKCVSTTISFGLLGSGALFGQSECPPPYQLADSRKVQDFSKHALSRDDRVSRVGRPDLEVKGFRMPFLDSALNRHHHPRNASDGRSRN